MRKTFIAVLLIGLNSCGSSEKKPAGPLNLILVTIDTLRADHLGCYGYAKASTPNLDKLAQRGTLFENAVTHAPLTTPSHASMFTGNYPTVHKVRDTGGFVLQGQNTTLAEMLRQAGWETAAFVGASVLKKSFGFAQGFSIYDDQMPKPDRGAAVEFPERKAAEVVDRALSWLGGRPAGKPFFLWVHVFDPHSPYDPPAPLRGYDGEVTYADQQLGRLFERAPENTVIAVLSDHGESLGDHGEYTHGVFLYDSTLRIAFMLSGPGVPRKLRVKQQARTIDLAPTLLELLGVKASQAMQGTSLAPAFTGKEVQGAESSYAETLFTKLNLGWAELRAVRTNRWKYIRAPKPELYDLAADPGEASNVIDAHSAEVQELEAKLKQVTAGPEKVETATVDRHTLDQLKSLGYAGGASQGAQELTGKGIDPKDRTEVLKLLYAVSPDSGVSGVQRVEMLRRAVELDPTNPTIYYHLGQEYANAGNAGEAMKLYRDGIRHGVKTAWIYSRLANILVRQGQRNEAIALFEKASQLNPSDSESLSDLGLAYLDAGKLADAERVLRWSLATGEEYPGTYNTLGLVFIEKQDLTKARVNFEKAVQLDPDLLEAQLNLGRLYKMNGDMKRARERFEAFLAKAPRAEYGHIIPKIQAELAGMP